MSNVPNGTDHPPPEVFIAMARVSMAIRAVINLPFSLTAPKGAEQEKDIEPAFLGPIRDEINRVFGREIPPLPPSPEEGTVWKLGSLTKHLHRLLNTP